MTIPYHTFTKVVPTTCIMKAIRITGYNLQDIYITLKELGCITFPDETHQYGYIWVYDPDTKECESYTEEEFNKDFTNITNYLEIL